MNLESLRSILGDYTLQRIEDVARGLNNSAEFHSPIAWRKSIPELAALDLPERFGGSPLSAVQMMSVFRAFGRLSADLRDVPGLGHGRVFALADGSSRFAPVLQRIARAESFAAICITEETGGTDLRGLCTAAHKVSGGYEITGEKCFVARLRQADIFVVFARTASPRQGLTAFLVEADNPGIAIRDVDALGLKGISWGRLSLDRAFVPAEHRLSEEGGGFRLFEEHFSFWRCAMAAAAAGAAEDAMEKAKMRLHQRTAFSAPIGRFTHLQQQYAFHASRLHMAWLLIRDAAGRIDEHGAGRIDSAMAKAEVVEICLEAVQWAMLVHGAHGYSVAGGLEKTLRDLLGLRIADGTTDVLRGQVARGLLSEELYAQSLGRPILPIPNHERASHGPR